MQRHNRNHGPVWIVSCAFAMLIAVPAAAQEKAKETSIWDRSNLSGDWGGARTALKNKGVEITINSTDEVFGVLSGGLRRQGTYEGQTEFTVDADLAKLTGWSDTKAHITVFDIRDGGRNVIQNTGSVSDPSNIDAIPTVRLYDAWIEREFGEGNSVRVGQILGDGEFMTAPSASGLINGTFGWDDLLSANMISGGPAYPLATPGALINAKITDALKFKTAIFSGNPAGSGCSKLPQECNLYGTRFSFSGGVLWVGELQYAVYQGKDAAGLPGVYKVGGWYASAKFNDLHFGISPFGSLVSLGSDASASPVQHSGDGGIYAVADQMVWRFDNRSLNLFVRGGLAPTDRNLVSYYIDGGAAFKGWIPGRANDKFTLAVAYAKISPDAAAADRDAVPPVVVRDYEAVFEFNYTAQIAPWWTLQPDVQYIVHPNGGQNPGNPAQRINNALISGLRSTVKF